MRIVAKNDSPTSEKSTEIPSSRAVRPGRFTVIVRVKGASGKTPATAADCTPGQPRARSANWSKNARALPAS